MNVSAVALMVVVTLQLGAAILILPQAPFVDFFAVVIAVISAVLAIRGKVNSAWLVLGGALIGLSASLVGYI